MSTAAPIRFRCFQCHKLLGVSRSKGGAVVACPRCAVELIVPEPEPDGDAVMPLVVTELSPIPEPSPPRTSPSASRVAPAVILWDASPDPDGSSVNLPTFPHVELEPVSLRSQPSGRSGGTPSSRSSAPSREPVVLPALEIPEGSIRDGVEAPGLSRSRGTGPRRDDVVLPRAAVVLWSFAVIVALAMTFLAGLLAGRFLWAPRSAVAEKTVRAASARPGEFSMTKIFLAT